jgi:hypothetical protein
MVMEVLTGSESADRMLSVMKMIERHDRITTPAREERAFSLLLSLLLSVRMGRPDR